MTLLFSTVVIFTSLLSPSPAPFQSEGKPVQAKIAEPVEDHSLTMEEYIKLGMPSLDKVWGAKELTKAAEVMAKLKKTPDQLPRFKSSTSGALFARLIDMKNLELQPNESDTVQNSLKARVERFIAIKELFKCYLMTGWPLRTMTVELVEFYDVFFNSINRMTVISEQFMTTIEKTDPTYAFRLKSFKQFYAGIDLSIQGLIGSVSERVYMTLATRQRLAEIIEKRLPEVLNDSNFDPFRKKHRQSIVTLLEKETDPKIRSSLSKAIESIKP